MNEFPLTPAAGHPPVYYSVILMSTFKNYLKPSSRSFLCCVGVDILCRPLNSNFIMVLYQPAESICGAFFCCCGWKHIYGKQWLLVGISHNAHTINTDTVCTSGYIHGIILTRTAPPPLRSLTPCLYSLTTFLSDREPVCIWENNVKSSNRGVFPGCLFGQWSFRAQ